jgi:hypothetical protein
MSAYQLTSTDATVIRTADQANIPNDPGNRDWVEYQKWLTAGGVPDPYVPVPDSLLDPAPNPNERLNDGVKAAVETYNAKAPSQQPGPPQEMEARMLRLEETLKALCDAFMSAYQGEPPLPWKE